MFGPRQRPDLAIHKFARLMAAAKPIQMFGDGSTLARLHVRRRHHRRRRGRRSTSRGAGAPGFRVYNLGGSRTTTLKQLIDLVGKSIGMKPVIEALPEQPGDMQRTLADVTLSAKELGYAPKVSMEEGMRRFAEWWRGLE